MQQDQDWNYRYDEEGNLTQKSNNNISWLYNWNANGMLKNVKKPNGADFEFEYDALGRRTAKICNNTITRFLWDGNVLLHEWNYDVAERPQQIVNEFGEIPLDREESTPNVVTWVYEEGSFVPSAKIVNHSKYSIISDYIGRPVQAYSEKGELVWETDYDIYGGLRKLKGERDFIPFRQLGQYEDFETGLYYNRFRYYLPETGTYLSKDPIGLAGRNANQYAYTKDSNYLVDIFGLDITTFYHAGSLSGPIDPSKGRPNLDFNPSGKGGFYATTDLSQAEKWAEMRGHPEITRFDIPNSELEKLNIKSFSSASDEWGKFVTDGRNGSLVHDFDAVSGPMLANPKGGKKPKAIGSQIAIFTESAAKLFDKFKVCN